jgi:hypothetical protein
VKQKCCSLGFFVVLVFLVSSFASLSGDQAIIAPAVDVYIITFGGGEGLNTFIKYNITPVPFGVEIDSVFIRAYVWEIGGTWDGDVMFCNVNDQAWTEADSAQHIINLPLSDSVLQGSGFGDSVGFTQSVDITDVFLVDYNASNMFCTFKLKDPDDGTFNPMPGSYPINSADTLGLGNTAFGFHIYFYPSEYSNAPPWLEVNYHATGIEESPLDDPVKVIKVYPNPFRSEVRIQISEVRSDYCPLSSDLCLHIYDLAGRLVRELYLVPGNSKLATEVSWDGRNSAGKRVAPGIYFLVRDGFAPVQMVRMR